MLFHILKQMQIFRSKGKRDWCCQEFYLDENVVYYFKCATVDQISDILKKHHAIDFYFFIFT